MLKVPNHESQKLTHLKKMLALITFDQETLKILIIIKTKDTIIFMIARNQKYLPDLL